MNRTKLWLILVVAASALGVSLSVLADEDAALVSIEKYKYIPAEVTVKVGETVRWVNNEKRQYHSVWFEESGAEPSEYFFPDETYERTFDNVGAFPYTCEPHPEMKGIVHVVK
ncbi:hypothetical protein MNBD_GAMMA26-1013 [hydrothermal vent metagenome]|uniref:Blue (type 1) copper domain-containing protein n=1 Tax=hydrothermal vent metagenome TaxID=652676 RepID=A0A3B1B2Q0_9ZZZZ